MFGPGTTQPPPDPTEPTVAKLHGMYEETIKCFGADTKTAYYAGFQAAILMFMASCLFGGFGSAIHRFEACNEEIQQHMKEQELNDLSKN